MRKQFGVIGLGKFGSAVAINLEKLGYPVLAIDNDPEVVSSIKDRVSFAEIVDATNPEALEATGIKNCDTVIVAVGDVESSVLIALILEEIGIHHIIAKANSQIHGRVLKKIGVKEIVFPEEDMGFRIANKVVFANILDYIEITPEVDLVEYKVLSKDLIGRSLQELALRNRFGITVIAIRRGDKVIVSPQADERFLENDVVFLVGTTEDITNFKETFG
ncbi:MAG: TrkA family potassium uptake protein [Caldisericaceae bacterium]